MLPDQDLTQTGMADSRAWNVPPRGMTEAEEAHIGRLRPIEEGGTMSDRETTVADGTEEGGALAEVDAVIETASKVAHEGLAPGADGPRVLAGLILQLAEQVARLNGAESPHRAGQQDRSPNEADAPVEEDSSPEGPPAEPSGPV